MLLIDVHAHMDLNEFTEYDGIDGVINLSIKSGVKTIISNGTDIESNRRVIKLSEKYPIIKVALGIYPTHCLEMIEAKEQEAFDSEIKFIEEQIKHKKCIAIGEVGLEYKEIKELTEEKKEIQKTCLKKFIELAKKNNIPIILHSRGAELELIEFLEKNDMKNRKVVMHCFSGRKHLIERIKQNGWFFSIPCNIARSEHFQNIVATTDINQLLTETDTPYLSPTPGTTNKPDNVIHTINKIAEIKKITPEEASNMIYANYMKLFL